MPDTSPTTAALSNNQGNIELPIVTVFGAGVAGLSAAHELIERGFRVQVVEPKQSPTCEYECAVGGLAANQFTRVRASLQTLHPWLLRDENVVSLAYALAFRDWREDIEQTAKRYPLNQRLRFDRFAHRPGGSPRPPDREDLDSRSRLEPKGPIPAEWPDYWDAHGILNSVKLQKVFDTIRDASQAYMRLYFPALEKELSQGRDPDLKGRGDLCRVRDTDDHAREFIARETFFVRVVGYTDGDETDEVNREIARHWANQVRQALIDKNVPLMAAAKAGAEGKDGVSTMPPIWELPRRLEVVVRGSTGVRDGADARERKNANRVEFEVVEQIIPGEHGFRFFPGFYRHLFDTMKRTPILDSDDVMTGTAYEQLVVTPHPQLALKGGLQDFDFRTIGSLTKLKTAKELFVDKLGINPKDFAGLQFRSLRYLFSGDKRRKLEAEPISLITYLGGRHPEKRFSKQCLDFIDRAPRALAAMSARESDARTQFDISLQLMIPGLPDPMTLNGPTSLVWLDRWKAYLKRQGVAFFVGEITDIRIFPGNDGGPRRFVPVVQGPAIGRAEELHPFPEDPDDVFWQPGDTLKNEYLNEHRFVLATQFQTASARVWSAYEWAVANNEPFEGPFRQLVAFDEMTGRRALGQGAAQPPKRNPITGKEPATWPTRTISGLQFFFPQSYRFGQSNIYFGYSEYALTSISQYAYWRRHSQPVGQLLGQISIDIGDWHNPYPPANPATQTAPGHPAFYASAKEVANYTWEQVKAGFDPIYAKAVQQPLYYHLDQNMVYSESGPNPDPAKPGWRHAGAVRANATVRAPAESNPSAAFALTTDRDYELRIKVGVGGPEVFVHASIDAADPRKADPRALRDRLLASLQTHDRLLADRRDSDEGADIVLSPVVDLPSAIIRVIGGSADPYQIKLGDRLISVPAPMRDAAGVTDAIAAQLAAEAQDLVHVARLAPNTLSLRPVKGNSLTIATLNITRQIELVGAPTLTLNTLNLLLIEPREGFVLMRNDYEYLINIPDQWRARPGLRRDADFNCVADGFWKFTGSFGVKNPEICYLHPESAPALQYWVGAGTYMATYTRMTTMESAAESGRHAAAAIIFEIFDSAMKKKQKHYLGLAGDFPAIYPVEDNEYEDLAFFTKLDDALCEKGLPHLFDILGITQLGESLLDGANLLDALRARVFARLKLDPAATLLSPQVAATLLEVFGKFFGDATRRSV